MKASKAFEYWHSYIPQMAYFYLSSTKVTLRCPMNFLNPRSWHPCRSLLLGKLTNPWCNITKFHSLFCWISDTNSVKVRRLPFYLLESWYPYGISPLPWRFYIRRKVSNDNVLGNIFHSPRGQGPGKTSEKTWKNFGKIRKTEKGVSYEKSVYSMLLNNQWSYVNSTSKNLDMHDIFSKS